MSLGFVKNVITRTVLDFPYTGELKAYLDQNAKHINSLYLEGHSEVVKVQINLREYFTEKYIVCIILHLC